ncbi:MAG: Hcp family type VI secretion system effector [Nitrospirae bacterium]|nr:Hcp family type VI secretion system effector [Nitrospirota bacterium]
MGAMPLHMELTGEKQGKIEGSCDMKGREGTIFVYSLQHGVSIPYHTGGTGGASIASGKRVHSPLQITKQTDKSTPKLLLALSTGENIKELKIKWYRISKQGKEEHYFTTKLESAVIVDAHMHFVEGGGGHMEQISFAYKKITWTWEVDGVETSDDWSAPSS